MKKRAPLKNDTALKVKGSKKGQNQTSSSTAKKPVASVKPPPCGKRQAVMADIPLVKLPWSVSTQSLQTVVTGNLESYVNLEI